MMDVNEFTLTKDQKTSLIDMVPNNDSIRNQEAALTHDFNREGLEEDNFQEQNIAIQSNQ